jgi:hypothetical protein
VPSESSTLSITTKLRIVTAKLKTTILLKSKGAVRLRGTGSMPVFGVTVALV